MSLQAVDLRCRVVSESFQVGELSLSVTGGRAFMLPATNENAQEIPRLTKQSLQVSEDQLGLLSGSIIALERFRANLGGAQVLYSEGGRWNLRLASLADQSDVAGTVTIELTQYRSAEEGGTRVKFVGFCQQTTRPQDPLSADETKALLSGLGNQVDEILRNTLDAAPPAIAVVPARSDAPRPQATERTPESVTLPLQVFDCSILSDESASGQLQFTMTGGRGYLEPNRFSTRAELTTTQRTMKIDRDTLELFSNKYPIGELRNRPGPFDMFQDLDGANWSLGIGGPPASGSPASRENREGVEVVKFAFGPSRTRAANEVQPRVAQRYIGLCRKTSSSQTALSSEERRKELWQ